MMYNPFIGIFKFILALLVVAIHVEPFAGDIAFYINNCIARIAVPSFFVFSSYFLFDKLLNHNWDKKIFWKQQKHLAKYYLIWLLLHSPIIVSRVYESASSVGEFIWLLFQAVCLKGPYGALWFLPATLMAVTLVYYLGKKTSPMVCLIVSFPLFLFAALETEYYVLIQDILWMEQLNKLFIMVFGWLANGLTFGFFFCSLGFYMAHTEMNVHWTFTSACLATKHKPRTLQTDMRKAVLSFLMLFVETTIIRDYKLGVSYGAMLMLIPTVYYIAQVLLRMKKTSNQKVISTARYLQNMSLLIYPMHFAIMELLEYVLRDSKIYMSSTVLQYLLVSVVTCGISAVIIYLGDTKKLGIARALYGK